MNYQNKMEEVLKSRSIEELNSYSVSELEAMAIEANEIRTKCRVKDETSFYFILRVRQIKLNRDFVFTPEYIEKFLWIDREIKKCVNKLQKRGERLNKHLERQIKKKNSFFNDYEIEALIDPKILVWKEEYQSLSELDDDDGILNVIDEFHYNNHFKLEFNLRHPHSCYFHDNWNTMVGAGDTFANYHIGYGMHKLYDHSFWSLSDIVKINEIWCDLRVEYQHF